MLRIIFNIKGLTSFLQLRHDTNILSLEECCKEIGSNCFLNPMLIVLNIIFMSHSSRRKEYFVEPDGVHFIDLLLNQNSTFTPFGHVPLVIFGMVFSLLSFRAV